MKKLFCLFALLLATSPSFAQNEEPIDSIDLTNDFQEWIEEQRVTEICGIKFGTSYETAQSILENKYGEAEYDYTHSKQTLTFKNKRYAGFRFDTIHFLFQSDGYRSYMNGCVFILDAYSTEEAKEKRDKLYNRLHEKYYMQERIDKNGFKYYLGGISPVDDNEAAFVINVIKYDKDLAKQFYPYSARLMYGTYDYVKEEF